MKVLHIIDSLHIGGAQKLLVTYAEQAKLSGMQTIIISLNQKDESPMTIELESLGAFITYFPARRLFTPSRFFQLFGFMKNGNFDIVHTHLTYANILGMISASLLGLPVVVSMHNVLSGRRENTGPEKLEQFLLQFATRIIAVGENVAADYRKLFPKKVETLANAVTEYPPLPAQERLTLRKKLMQDETVPLLIAVGRLTYQKGFSDLVSAFKLIHIAHPQAKLIVAGDGELREELQKETDNLGLQEHLLWLGMRNDVQNLLSISDIYLSSSKWEGLSVAMLEAMSNGLAPVATEVGDAAKVIVPGAGFLVPPGQPEKLAEEVCTLLADPAKIQCTGQAARERIRTEYGAQRWFAGLHRIYQQAIVETTA